ALSLLSTLLLLEAEAPGADAVLSALLPHAGKLQAALLRRKKKAAGVKAELLKLLAIIVDRAYGREYDREGLAGLCPMVLAQTAVEKLPQRHEDKEANLPSGTAPAGDVPATTSAPVEVAGALTVEEAG
ncbi:hypothetical protein Agub_g6690, partial [Astrephomene gubernaculifera]